MSSESIDSKTSKQNSDELVSVFKQEQQSRAPAQFNLLPWWNK
jgi:hypothetical protein